MLSIYLSVNSLSYINIPSAILCVMHSVIFEIFSFTFDSFVLQFTFLTLPPYLTATLFTVILPSQFTIPHTNSTAPPLFSLPSLLNRHTPPSPHSPHTYIYTHTGAPDRSDPMGVDMGMDRGLQEPTFKLPPSEEPLWLEKIPLDGTCVLCCIV